jgi:photosystem II stability/assembly factor-like uncharacterized protein
MWSFLILLLATSFAATDAFAQSFQQQVVASGKSLDDVQMLSTSVGYAGGVDGVYKTVNGGATWTVLPAFTGTVTIEDIYLQSFNVVHLAFSTELKGIAYGWNAFSNFEMIIRTADGGATWAIEWLNVPQVDDPVPINFLNAHHAWDGLNMIIAGANGRLIRTNDGGVNWTDKRIGGPNPDLSTIQFTSATRGYAAGEGYFYTTTDGGGGWNLNNNLGFSTIDFHFFSDNQGIAIGGSSFYRTSDGGFTWTKNLMEVEGSLAKIHFADNTTGYATTTGGKIYKSTDGGATWLRVYSNTHSFTSLFTLTPDLLWFSTAQGYLLHSSTGGAITFDAPVFTTIFPAAGEIGNAVTILATNPASVTGILFNGIPASFKLSGTSLETKVPGGASTGKITLIWPGGTVESPSDFVISLAPQLDWPAGPAFAGAVKVLKGQNLQYVNSLTFDGVAYPFNILSSQEISFSIPENFPLQASKQVKVVSPHGSATVTLTLTGMPSVNTSTERMGSSGQIISIWGTEFESATAVFFGEVQSPSFTIVDNTTIRAVVPEVPEEYICMIRVVTPVGRASALLDFTAYPRPEVTGASPLTIRSGELLTITGNNLPSNNRVYVGGIEVYDVTRIDSHTLTVLMPPLMSGDHAVKVVAPVNSSGSKTFSFTVTGTAPYKIETVMPERTSPGTSVAIKGHFNFIDSVTVNGISQDISFQLYNSIYIFPTAETTSGPLVLWRNGQAIAWDRDLEITENPAPRFTFSPAVAAPGMQVNLELRSTRYILSVEVNGKPVPFTPEFAIDNISSASFTVTDEVTTGRIRVTTIDGFTESSSDLVIKSKEEVRPAIYSWQYLDEREGYLFKLIGRNFNNVTAARLDNYPTGFRRVSDDTLYIEIPPNADMRYLNTLYVVLESPLGDAYVWLNTTSYPTQTILSASPLEAKRGSVVTVNLSTKKKPYVNYPNYYNFFFNDVMVDDHVQLNDTTWQLTVPMEGNVEGKIGITGGGIIYYTDYKFKVAQTGYCSATGFANPSLFPLDKIMIQGKIKSVTNEPYLDYSATPIKVIPGQALRLGVTPSQQGVVSKIFIDWNANEEFDEPGIQMVDASQLPPEDSMIYIMVPVPPTAVAGTSLKMRIVTTLYSTEDLLPCGLRVLGQVIDHQINVVNPSATLEVLDFFPQRGNVNTFVTIYGDNLNAVQAVSMNGFGLTVISQNEHTLTLTIPEGVTGNGPLVVTSPSGTVITQQQFVMDESITPLNEELNNAFYTYRVTIGGRDVPFYISKFEEYGFATAIQVNDLENGIKCIYTPGGSHCDEEPIRFESQVNFPEPFIVREFEPFILTGRNMNEVTGMTLDDGTPVPFTLINKDSLVFTPPAINQYFMRTLRVSDSWKTVSRDMTYTDDTPCNPTACCTNQGTEIISVTFNEISNTSCKNITGGISDYSSQVGIVDRYHNYYAAVRVKNFGSTLSGVYVDAVITGDHTLELPEDRMRISGNSKGELFEPGEEKTLYVYIHIWDDLPLGESMGIWFNAMHYMAIGNFCNPNIGEIEKYSLFIRDPETTSSLAITSMSHQVAPINATVTLTGIGFDNVKSVQIGNLYAAFTIQSPTQIQFTVPQGALTDYVKVNSYASTAQSPERLKIIPLHTVTSVNPPYGRIGTVITVKGSGFTNVTSAWMDDVQVGFSSPDGNTIRITIPATGKTGPIRLRNNYTQEASSTTFYVCDDITPNPYCKLSQQITFTPVNDVSLSQLPLTLHATATSGLDVSFTSADDVTINNNVLNTIAPGRVTVRALQNGNANYETAAFVERNFCINPNKPFITQLELTPGNITLTSSSSTDNHWFRNGEPLLNSFGNSIPVDPEGGVYTVSVSADDCFSELSDEVALIITGNEKDVRSFSFHPNPVREHLNIQSSTAFSRIRIAGASGGSISTIELPVAATQYSLDLRGVSSGIYIVELYDGKRILHRQKIVKQ